MSSNLEYILYFRHRIPTKTSVKHVSPVKVSPTGAPKSPIKQVSPQKPNATKAKAVLNLNTVLDGKSGGIKSPTSVKSPLSPTSDSSSVKSPVTASPSVSAGDNTTKSAGTLVLKSVPPHSMVPVIKPVTINTSSGTAVPKALSSVVLSPGSDLDAVTSTSTVKTVKVPVPGAQEGTPRYVTYKIVTPVKSSSSPVKSPTSIKTNHIPTVKSPPLTSKSSGSPIKVPATSTVKETTSSVKSPTSTAKKVEVKKVEKIEVKKSEKGETKKTESNENKKSDKTDWKKQEKTEAKKIEHKRDSETQQKKPSDPEPIRLNVRKTLQEVLQARYASLLVYLGLLNLGFCSVAPPIIFTLFNSIFRTLGI